MTTPQLGNTNTKGKPIMIVYGMWFGGSGYAPPTAEDLERFDSIGQAKRVFEARYDGDGGYTPCVDQDTTEMWLFYGPKPPEDNGDMYPDRIMRFGPRGGVHVELC